MFSWTRTALAVSVAIATLAYITRPRFPETVSNRGQKTFISFYLRLVTFLCNSGERFGLSRVNMSRAFMDVQLLVSTKLDTVQEYTTVMDGVEVTIYKPVSKKDGLRPGIVHFHGGGWVTMAPEHYGPELRVIVEHTDSVVVSVNYRLAPEHIFPIPVEDCITATIHFLKHAETYGVDPNRIGVKGDSAGGNLAMATALRLASEADPTLPTLKLMSLDYPALQAFDFELPSYIKHEHGPGLLHKDTMLLYWQAYGFGHLDFNDHFYTNNHTSPELKASVYGDFVNWDHLPNELIEEYNRTVTNKGDKEVSDKIKDVILDPLFAPLMASDADLGLLPPAYILSVEYDVLRDDAFIAASRLRAAGVSVEHNYLPAEQHGLLSLVLLDQNAVDEIINFSRFFKQIMK